MASIQTLQNINFMSKNTFEAQTSYNSADLYAVKADNISYTNEDQTITAIKTFSGKNTGDTCNLVSKIGFDTSIITDEDRYSRALELRDQDGFDWGNIFMAMKKTSGTTYTGMQHKRVVNGTTLLSSVEAWINAAGERWATAPASSVIGSIITTVALTKSLNGCLELGNNVKFQWGDVSSSNQIFTGNFPIAFTTTNYVLLPIRVTNYNTTNDGGQLCWRLNSSGVFTTSSFTIYSTSSNTIHIRYIAIGY